MTYPAIGSTVTCAETGKAFIVAQEGCTMNYGTSQANEILSHEGAHIRGLRNLKDRTRPLTCYLSSDMRHATDWVGNVLGTIISANKVRLTRFSYIHGNYVWAVTVRDVHGGLWYGRGSGGVCINLRAKKSS